VRYGNGSARVRKVRWFVIPNYDPEPRAGSVIIVPTRDPADKVDVRAVIADSLQIITSVTAVVLLFLRR